MPLVLNLVPVAVPLIIACTLLSSHAIAENIPIEFSEILNTERCTIPAKQTKWEGYVQEYIFSGAFAHAGQKDIAVICYKKDKAYLRVLWGGEFQCKSEVEIFYAELISVVGEEYILSHFEAYGGPTPPKITHLGIDLGNEKASTVHYCHKGIWLKLTGAD